MDTTTVVIIVGVCLAIGSAAWRCLADGGRIRAIELEIERFRDPHAAIATLETRIRTLDQRVARLESVAVQPTSVLLQPPVAIPPPLFTPPLAVELPIPSEITISVELATTEVERETPTLAAQIHVGTPIYARPPLIEVQPSHSESKTEAVHVGEERREDWEAIIGGNWLNKLGVLVLVIGISLFLGYSLTQLGPAGRVGLGLAASAMLLVVGMAFERKPGYATFGRGLIGGGWAGIYFTTYAMHGLDAARVITSPLVASSALALVATGMIVHSLRYRSQVVTGLAYFIGFATLAITPVTTFSIAATLPLAASLLFVAQRFRWTPMAVVGLVASYGTYLVAVGPTPALGTDQFVREQLVLALYWLMFEAFDLLSERKNAETAGRRLLFPLNACGFVGVSFLHWSTFVPARLYLFFAIAAAAYVASTVARALLLGGNGRSISAESPTPSTSYRLSVTVAVALVIPGIFLRFSGMQLNLALLLTAEFLFLSGLQFGDSYLRWLAACVLGVPVLKCAAFDIPLVEPIAVGPWTVMRATPMAALTAGVLYMNRALVSHRARADERICVIAPETVFRAAAAALLALIVARETPHAYVGAGWLVLALVLFEIGVRTRLVEFRSHAYVIGAAGLAAMTVLNAGDLHRSVWFALALDATLAYACVARLELVGPDTLSDLERRWCARACACTGAALGAALIWTIAPLTYLGTAWLLWAWTLFEVGLRPRFADFRLQAYAVALLAVATLFIDAFPATINPRHLLMVVGMGSVLLWAGFARALRLPPDRLPEREGDGVRDLSAAGSTALVGILIWQLLPPPVVAIGWAVMGLLLLDLGFGLSVASLRAYGHIALGLMLGRLMMANLTSADTTYGISHRLLTMVPVIGLLYFLTNWLKGLEEAGETKAWERGFSRAYVWAGTLVAVLLVAFEFGRTEATAGWALLALGLVTLGLRWKNRDLWWQSYLIAILTFVRSWVTDFYIPASLAGPMGRVTTAATVIASFYVAQLLSPDRYVDRVLLSGTGFGELLKRLERHARTTFSVMATVLLAKLLFHELSSGFLTIGWSVQGAVLLGSGFVFGDRILRRSGLLLLAICTTKAFAYDFRVLDTFSRILSFIMLGIVLLVTSWVYARYGERLRRYL